MRPIYHGTGDCYVDIDLSFDSNFDGKADNDRDLLCNVGQFITIDPYVQSINGRLYYE